MKIWKSCAMAVALAVPAAGAPLAAQGDRPVYGENYAQDRAEIEDLMARYLFAIDYHDWDAYVATFAPDGEIEFASGTFKGRDEIREAVTSFAQRIGEFYTTEDGSAAKLRHVILQSSIRVEGDRAWATSLWVEMANDGPEDTLKMGTFGVYEDEMERIDGQWLFTRRNVLNDFLDGRHSGPENPVRSMDAAARSWRGQTGG